MTLKQKFTWLSAAAVALVALAGILNARTLDRLVVAAEGQENAARVIRAHMHADMMHDALHADVMKALYARATRDAALAAAAAAAARADGAALAADIETAISHNPPAAIAGELQAMRSLVSGYALAAAELTGRKPDARGTNARTTDARLSAFETAFGALKEKNDKLGAQLGGWLHGIGEKQEILVQETKSWNALTALLIVLITLGIPVFARRQVFTPLESLIGVMKDISAGRLGPEVRGTERGDEVGDISRALAVFRANAQEKQRLEAETEALGRAARALEAETAALKTQAEEDRRRALFGLADNFEANVKSVADTVATAATEMDATSRDVMQRAHDSADKLGLLVSGIAGASQNVQTVAAAAAELSASIHEIAAQVGRGGKIMYTAVAEAVRANEKAESLTAAAARIGSVVDVINDITEQINLLALNATIEAARAGEQGRGFAVVASEVKNLAGQTTAATRQIEEQIGFIQGAAADTVAVMQQVTATISEMNKISASIAAAVEEQGMATQEIARNVQQAAEITKTVSTNATDVRHSSAGASSAFSQMIAAASDLSRQSESLRGQVGAFLKDIKAA